MRPISNSRGSSRSKTFYKSENSLEHQVRQRKNKNLSIVLNNIMLMSNNF